MLNSRHRRTAEESPRLWPLGSTDRQDTRAPVSLEEGRSGSVPDYRIFEVGDVELQSGETLPNAKLAYKTYGELNRAGDNVILMPTFFSGTHADNEYFVQAVPELDPSYFFIVSINTFGNGLSSSPSNTPPPFDGPRFPVVTIQDNVACQHRLLTEVLGVKRIALVLGWSTAGSQAYQWGAQYPEMVDAILPFCSAARSSEHTKVFLEGLSAALTADDTFTGGDYTTPPEAGLRALGRVSAGWAYSQGFFGERRHCELGLGSWEEVLRDAECEYLKHDANDMLASIRSWQMSDISANERYRDNMERALGAIRARAIVVSCTTDLCCPPENNAFEVERMPNAELRPYVSSWGHSAASPTRGSAAFMRFLDGCLWELLAV